MIKSFVQVYFTSLKVIHITQVIWIIFFNKTELLQLITSNVFSILYYNLEIWHLPSLKTGLKQKLISVSAKAIKICMYYPDPMISYVNIHSMSNRARPEAIMKYKWSLQLFKLYNTTERSLEWTSLNIRPQTDRQTNSLTPNKGVCGFFLSVKFATSLLATLAGD